MIFRVCPDVTLQKWSDVLIRLLFWRSSQETVDRACVCCLTWSVTSCLCWATLMMSHLTKVMWLTLHPSGPQRVEPAEERSEGSARPNVSKSNHIELWLFREWKTSVWAAEWTLVSSHDQTETWHWTTSTHILPSIHRCSSVRDRKSREIIWLSLFLIIYLEFLYFLGK